VRYDSRIIAFLLLAELLGLAVVAITVPHAKRILDACDKLFRWGSATRGQLTAEQRERLSAMSLDDIIAALM
jgi:hypothetical protein